MKTETRPKFLSLRGNHVELTSRSRFGVVAAALLPMCLLAGLAGCQKGGRGFNPYAAYGSPRIPSPGTQAYGTTGGGTPSAAGNASQPGGSPAIGSGVANPANSSQPYYQPTSPSGSGGQTESVPGTGVSYPGGTRTRAGSHLPPSRSNRAATTPATGRAMPSVQATPVSEGVRGRWRPVDPQGRNGSYPNSPTTQRPASPASRTGQPLAEATPSTSPSNTLDETARFDPAVQTVSYDQRRGEVGVDSPAAGGASRLPWNGMRVNDATPSPPIPTPSLDSPLQTVTPPTRIEGNASSRRGNFPH